MNDPYLSMLLTLAVVVLPLALAAVFVHYVYFRKAKIDRRDESDSTGFW